MDGLAMAIRRITALTAVLAVLAACAFSPDGASESSPVEADVNQIIQKIEALPAGSTSASKQQALFDQLVAMGPKARPSNRHIDG